MIALFRDKSLVSFFLLAILCVLTHIHIFHQPVIIGIQTDNGLLSFLIKRYINALIPSVQSCLFLLIIFTQALWLNILLNAWKMFQKSALTTAAAFILLSACFPELNCISPALINNFLVILFIALFARMYNHPKASTLLFNIGTVASIAALLYQPDVIFILITFLSLAIVRPFRLKEWLILLIGIVVPIYILAAYLFMKTDLPFIKTMIPYFQIHRIVLKMTVWHWIKVSVVLLSLLIGINQWLPNYDRMVIHIRRNWIILFLSMLILGFLPFVLYNGNIIDFWIVIPFMACFVSSLFLFPKRLLIPNFIFILFVVLITHTNLLMMGLIKK